MKKYFILGVLFVLILSGCYKNINKEDGHVFYEDNEKYKHYKYKNENGEDKYGVYWKCEKSVCASIFGDHDNHLKIKGSDTETFEAINDYIAKDENNVYCSEELESVHKIIEDVNPEMMEVLNHSYMIDKENKIVYHDCEKIKKFDIDTFEVFNYHFVKDKNGIYDSDDKKIENADTNTFEVLRYAYAKDKNNVYFKNKKIENVDYDSFVALHDYCYAKDNKKIYFENKVINVDYRSFEVLEKCYAKDKNNVYYEDIKLEMVDYNSFKIVEGHARDKNNCYLFEKAHSRPDCNWMLKD